jgi:RNA polymerase sigma-70 factor (ECF subfamily)
MKEFTTVFDEERHVDVDDSSTPETILIAHVNSEMLNAAIEELPAEYREVLILRELEGYAYKEIAEMADVPIGTVMSRLARARRQLQRKLAGQSDKED